MSLRKRSLKPVIIVIVCLVLLPVLLFTGVLTALTIPSVQQKAASTAARILSGKLGIEAGVGHFSVRPPFNILLEDVFAGDGRGDTLAYVGCLDLRLRLDELPDSIAVKRLEIKNLTAHTGDFVPSLRIDGRIGRLSARVKSLSLREMVIPIEDAVLEDAEVSLKLDTVGREALSNGGKRVALAIDIRDISLENVKFGLEPVGLELDIDRAGTSTLIDLGASCYTVRRLDVADMGFRIRDFELPVGRVCADAVVDVGNSLISSGSFFAGVPSLQAEVSLRDTRFDLAQLRLETVGRGSYEGAPFSLDAAYDVDDEVFKATLDFGRIDLAPILEMAGYELVVAGHVSASGSGIDPSDSKMAADVLVGLDSCRFNGIDVSGVRLEASLKDGTVRGGVSSPVHCRDSSFAADLTLDSRFEVGDFLGKFPAIGLEAELRNVSACFAGDTLETSALNLDFKTGRSRSEASVNMSGMALDAKVAAHVLEIPSLIRSFPGGVRTLGGLDSLIAAVPAVNADIEIVRDSPLRAALQRRGFDLERLVASLRSSGMSRKIDVTVETPALEGKYRLPAMNAGLAASLSGSRMDAALEFNSVIRDGLMSVRGIDSGVDLRAVLSRAGEDLRLDGDLKLASLIYDGRNIGDRDIRFNVRPDAENPGRFVAGANIDDIPVDIVKQFAAFPEGLDLQGKIKARAEVSGLPDRADVFVGVKPVGVGASYRPYDVQLQLGGQEITLEGNRINMNGISLIGADSTFLALDGGLDLGTMLFDVSMKSDRFEPMKLPKDGPFPIHGKLLIGLDASITGPVDSLLAGVEVSILPETDITYPIDRKNLVQVSPSGTVKMGFRPGTGLALGGQLNLDKGKLFYSPKLYPMMPFLIDKGSYVRFNGAVEDTEFAISASQGAKATYKPVGEVSRMVDFVAGVRVGGSVEKLDIGFYLDAPKDREIRKELEEMPEEDREGLAAVLLATGMYASESNEAAQMEGYALSSIVQSKLNAATSNSLGNKVNLDFGVARGKHGRGVETTDYTINVSKSFFKDRLNVKIGGSVSDNAEVNRNSVSFLNNLSAEYKLDTAGVFKVRLFSVKDFNNIVEGELVKSGAGFLYNKTLERQKDSLDRSFNLGVEANIVTRSNNQTGPDAEISLAKNNLFGRNDVFTARLKGAYYWNLDRRKEKDPARNDTFLFGADFTLGFPYMQLGDWALKYTGRTSYRLGYLRQNISGDYGMHKLYGGFDYSLRQGKYITHGFSPLYLSIVLADRASEKLATDIAFNDLLKLFASNEFIPSVRYSFSYNNYRDRGRAVNTALDIQLKESANLISGIMAACGRDFNERDKTVLGISYDQFVKYQVELRNRFRLTDRIEVATRAFLGAVISFGNSVGSPLSESFSIGGPNSIRAFSPRSIGPGDFNNKNYSSQIFHAGDLKMELNAELRFPIVWKLNGAVFVDAGNVWNQRDPREYMSAEEIEAFVKGFNITTMYNTHLDAATFLNQIALGTGAGLRLDYESIVIRLDLGVAVHAPYDTGRSGYYNIPNFWKDGLRLNFGIGYPF